MHTTRLLYRIHSLAFILIFMASAAIAAPVTPQTDTPWQELGYSVTSGGFTPQLSIEGTARVGRQCRVTISDAPPGRQGGVYFGLPTYGVVLGHTLVPDNTRYFPFTVDLNGQATIDFTWTVPNPGEQRAFQAVIRDGGGGYAFSNASLGTAMTMAEGVVYDAALTASSNWQDVQVRSVNEVATISGMQSRQAAIDIMVALGAMPDMHWSGPGTPFGVGIIPQYYGLIPQAVLDQHETFLGSLLHDNSTLVEVVFYEPSVGSFSSYSVVHAGEDLVAYDTFMDNMCMNWPMPAQPVLSQAGSGFAGLPNSAAPPEHNSRVEWTSSNYLGVEMFSGFAELVIECDEEGNVNICSSSSDCDSSFTWEAVVSTSDSISENGDCCVVKASIGAASGLKGAKVGADGVSIEISGWLGQSYAQTVVLIQCCDDPSQAQ